ERLLAEAHGNPLALVELARGLGRPESAVGHGPVGGVAARIEEAYRVRSSALPTTTPRLLLVAAAEPLRDYELLTRAAATLNTPPESLDPAVEDGLIEVNERVVFCHPLARSALYRAATTDERRATHAALAQVTDPERDPDRCAWHRGQASVGPDEE